MSFKAPEGILDTRKLLEKASKFEHTEVDVPDAVIIQEYERQSGSDQHTPLIRREKHVTKE